MRALQPSVLKFLDHIARSGSMRKSAARLNVSPSSLNRQILALEADIGVPIFERMPRRLRLTAAGELVIAYARRNSRDLQNLKAQIDDLKGLGRREIRIAMMAGLASNFVTRVASSFQQKYPRVRLKFETNRLMEIMAVVMNGDADLGFAFGVKTDATIRIVASVECRLSAIVAPDHPLAGKGVVKLADCVAYPLVLPVSSMVFRGILDDAFTSASLSADPAIETDEFEMMKRFPVLHQGVAILNPVNVDVECQRGELVAVPIQDSNLASQTLTLFHRKRATLSTQANQFAEALRTALEDMAPASSPHRKGPA